MANYKSPAIFKNLKGKVFSRLTVLERTKDKVLSSTYAIWKCVCKCGKYINVNSNHLLTKNTKSCGCLQKEAIIRIGHKNRNKKGITPLNILYRNYKNNAKQRKLKFILSIEKFKKLIFQKCYYCGAQPNRTVYNYRRPKDKIICNGIDRKNNKKGYILNNCVSCCIICNRAKNNSSFYKFKKWIKQLTKYNRSKL